jgi:predicted AAA+ superfamily ATPase
VKPSYEQSVVLENAVFIQLRRETQEIFYWKDHGGQEVDFLVMDGGKPRLYQACVSLSAKETALREIAALERAMADLAVKRATIVTLNETKMVKTSAGIIDIVPFHQWALS